MSAFKDSGHFWWQRCPSCEMAWFVGEKPADPDDDVECDRCPAMASEIAAAEARGVERARDMAADYLVSKAGRARSFADHGAARTLEGLADDIRAMQDGQGREACSCGAPDPARPETLQAAHYADCPSQKSAP